MDFLMAVRGASSMRAERLLGQASKFIARGLRAGK